MYVIQHDADQLKPEHFNTASFCVNSTKQSLPDQSVAKERIPVSRYWVFCLLVLSGTFWDLYSKSVVFSSLPYPGGISQWTQTLFGGWLEFRLLTSFNEGALWGIGQGFTAVFAGMSLLAAVGVVLWLFAFRGAVSLWLTVALGLVMSGTLGNLYDRLGWHQCEIAGEKLFAVRDFLSFTFGTYHYPIFNYADVFLVTGAVMLGLFSFFFEIEPVKKESNKQPQKISA